MNNLQSDHLSVGSRGHSQ